MTKQTADLNNWIAVPDRDRPYYFIGEVRNHPRQADFHADAQRTSSVVSVDYDAGVLETQNTLYRLGQPATIL